MKCGVGRDENRLMVRCNAREALTEIETSCYPALQVRRQCCNAREALTEIETCVVPIVPPVSSSCNAREALTEIET